MQQETKKTEEEIVHALRVGDSGQTEEFVRRNIGWMLDLARRLIGDRALAEDAVQEAFVAAFGGIDRFQGHSSLKTWLNRITVNACLTLLRRSRRLAEQSIDDLLPEFDSLDCRIEPRWSNPLTVEDLSDRAETHELVATKMAELPDSYRIVLELRDIQGYDTVEVAELLQISESNVKVRLHRARAAFKKLLEPLLRGEV